MRALLPIVALAACADALAPSTATSRVPARLAAALAEPTAATEPATTRPAVDATASSFDPAPLVEQLRAGDFKTADQTTRDALIEMAGGAAVERGYVSRGGAETKEGAS